MVRELIIDPELERCLPPLPEIQYQKLKASIEKKYDPAKPIVLWKERPNTIVDGHHRYRACMDTGQEPTTLEESFATLEDAVLYALQRQIEQRNLTTAQMILITEQMMSIEEKRKLDAEAKANSGARTDLSAASSDRLSKEVARKIAEKAQTSAREVYRVQKIKKEGTPELLSLVESGEVCADYADRFVKRIPDKSDQKAVINSGGQEAVFEHVRQQRKEDEAKRAAQKEAAELERFKNFNRAVAQKSSEACRKIDAAYAAIGDGCFLPNVKELWCKDCQWGFDVFLPTPSDPCCPYCKGSNIEKRDPEWNPRIPTKECYQ